MFKTKSKEEIMIDYIERELCRLHELANQFTWDNEKREEVDPFISVMNEIHCLNAAMLEIMGEDNNEEI